MSERRTSRHDRAWWECMCRKGKACVCPLCGEYTTARHGFHVSCMRRYGVAVTPLLNADGTPYKAVE